MKKLHILHLEGNHIDAKLIQAALKNANIHCNIQFAVTREDFEKILHEKEPDLIFADYTLPNFDGLSALKIAKEKYPELPFLLISSAIGEEKIIEAFQVGVTDFINKQHLQRLIPAISRALAEANERKKRKAAEEALRESEEHYRVLASISPVGIFKTDESGKRFYYTNERAHKIIGNIPNVSLKNEWLQIVHPNDRETVSEAWNHTIKNGLFFQKEFRICRADDIDVWVICQAAPQKENWNQISSYIGTLTDITDLKKAEQKLQQLARFDPLTNLPNRLLFEETLERDIIHAKHYKGKLALFHIDLDHFKNVNATLGYSKGDQLLKAVGLRLPKYVRAQDFIARLDGDEFAIISEDFENIGELYALAEQVINCFKQSFHIEKHEIISPVNIGMVIYPEAGQSKEILMQHADQALSQAKAQGRNSYKFYTEVLQQQLERYALLEKHLHHALEKNEFSLYYQPLIHLKTNQWIGMEALLRWHNPILSEISPVEFIPIAENTGLIREIGSWVIENALKQYSEWRQKYFKNHDIKISINLSPSQLVEYNTIKMVTDILEKTKVNPENIVFEITETAVMKNITESKSILNALNKLGIGFAIDDFGVGYASLTYLRQLPIKILKIDKSFINNIGRDINSEAIVKAIINLSSSLDLDVIAEGVETENQVAFLKKNECKFVQGYYFSKPLPASQLETYMNANSR